MVHVFFSPENIVFKTVFNFDLSSHNCPGPLQPSSSTSYFFDHSKVCYLQAMMTFSRFSSVEVRIESSHVSCFLLNPPLNITNLCSISTPQKQTQKVDMTDSSVVLKDICVILAFASIC